jgi:imidazolonepropionase-like amidohydrolase
MKNISKLTAFFWLSGWILFFQPLDVFSQLQSDDSSRKVYKFINGQWFDGKDFRRETFFAVEGVLTKKKPAKIDETVDLRNGFVIPPFADAHTHNLDGSFNLEKIIKAYLREGTFYVQVLTNYATGAKIAKPFLNKPTSVDAIYANGGLTSTLGHPFLAYEPRAQGFYNYADWNANMDKIKLGRTGENNVYWFLDSRADVDAKWDKFLAQKPDVVKIYLLDAANYEQVSKNGKVGDKGLSPDIAEYVVGKAHAAGLRVYAHVETADDFRLGLKIGVDGFAHAPHYGWSGKPEDAPRNDLNIEDIRLAAKKKVVVIPTAQITRIETTDNPDAKQKAALESFQRVIERQKRLFGLMQQNGVTVALGSDYFGRTLSEELWHFSDNRIFDNQTLLRIATEITPRTIFPNRQIGRLREGYEASFLVLGSNPLKDFTSVKNIQMRFKQGVFITLAP